MAVNTNNPVDIAIPLSIFNLENKVDSADKIATVAGLPHNNFWWANEHNEMRDKAIQSALDNTHIAFSWSNLSTEIKENVGFIDKVHLLKMTLENNEALQNASEIYLLTKRYRPARKQRTSNRNTIDPKDESITVYPGTEILKPSGYRTAGAPSDLVDRPNELRIHNRKEVFDFKFENFFRQDARPFPSILRATGFKRQTKNGDRAYVKFQFIIKAVFNDKIYYSKPLREIQVICARSKNNSITLSLRYL